MSTAVRAVESRRMTVEEYFAFTETAVEKYDYINGVLHQVSGGTDWHSLIKAELIYQLKQQLRGRCLIYDSDMRVRIEGERHVYPDASLVVGPPELEGRTKLLNPTVVFEVLSPSTESYDREEKLYHYFNIPSVVGVVLIRSTMECVEVVGRMVDGVYPTSRVMGREASLIVPGVEVSIPLADLYVDVRFDEQPLGDADAADGSTASDAT